ncbi:hypothetical protein GBA52_013226 [Prunus armeniaca]|nr:hypothetical protein GBA52_013226 [Prunus armeniaca]
MEGRDNGEKGPEAEEGRNYCGGLSKSAQKKLLKQQKWEAKKAEKKALEKEQKKREGERKRKEWEERLASVSEEERGKLIESRKSLRKERMEQRSEERERNTERLSRAKECGQKIVIDLEFSHLMTPAEINSLVQQIMYCYAVNKRCREPGHLWLTGCKGEMGTQLKRLPGFDNWIIEKEDRSYMEALEDEKRNLVYLTADSENVVDDLDSSKIYIVGGLVDRNRWKGITMKKAEEQGIQTAKLPIANYLNMSSSQVLTVNQVIEILLKFLETKNWKDSFFQVIPQRKRCQADSEQSQQVKGGENGIDSEEKNDQFESKKQCAQDSTRIRWIDTNACLEAGQLREKHPNYELKHARCDIPDFDMKTYHVPDNTPLGEFVDFIQLQSGLSIKKPIFVFFKNTKTPTENSLKLKRHLWLTVCKGEMATQLKRLLSFDNWIIEKQDRSYIEALENEKQNLVYYTHDSENVVDDLGLNNVCIVGRLVDRNQWKGITMKKAEGQGIQKAKLIIANYLNMSSSQVLLLKFLETRNWKDSFFQVIPQRKRCQADSEEPQKVKGEEIERENASWGICALMSSAAGAEESDRNSSDDNDDNNGDDDINVIGVDGDDDINIIVVDSDDDGGGGDEPVGGGGGVPVYRNTYDNSYLVQELDLVQFVSVAAIGQQVMLLLANHHLDGINDPNDGFEIDFITKNGRLSRQQLEAFPWPQVVQMLVKIVAFDRFLPRMVGVCRFTPDSIHHFVDEVDLRTCDDVSDLEDQARDMLNLHTLNGYPDPPELHVSVCL